MTLKKVPRWLPIIQGIYFFITGAWALLHIESFIWVSGPKYDIWLVKTVGILIAIMGIVMFSAGYYKRINTETFLLAAGSAAGLATVDIYYVSIGRIWTIYLLDAGIEIVFLLLWLIKASRNR
jgi:hypothetical protein